jgi:cell division septal protein FtsQ
MKNEKGILKLVVLVIIVVIIAAAIYWANYFAKPMATVMMGGAEQAQPAIDKAQQASDTMSRVTQSTEEIERKLSEGAEK